MGNGEIGKKNLIPFSQLTEEEQKRIRSAGGKASQKVQKEKRDRMQLANEMLEMTLNDKNLPALKQLKKMLGVKGDLNFYQAIAFSCAITAFKKGDVNALKTIQELCGDTFAKQININDITPTVICDDIREDMEEEVKTDDNVSGTDNAENSENIEE